MPIQSVQLMGKVTRKAAERLCVGASRLANKAILSAAAVTVTIIASRCATWRCEARVDEVVTLETLSAPDEAIAGAAIQIQFALRNVGAAPVDICIQDGISTMMEDERGKRWPLKQYGLATSPVCSNRLHLDSNESKAFSEQVWIQKDSSPGAKLIEGSMYVRLLFEDPCADSMEDGVLRTTSKLRVVAPSDRG